MSQSLAKIYIHLVFSTKGRADTIPKANLEEVHAYMAEIFNNHGCPAIQGGFFISVPDIHRGKPLCYVISPFDFPFGRRAKPSGRAPSARIGLCFMKNRG